MSEPSTLRLAAVGDVMLGDSPQVFGFGVGSMIERYGPEFPFAGVAETLKSYDLVLANLEIVISAYDPKKTAFDQRVYRAQPHAVRGLTSAGVGVVSACTNHMMQHGRPALEEALEALERAGIGVIGIEMPERGLGNGVVVDRNGLKIAFAGYNFRPQQYFVDPPQWPEPDAERILDDVRAVRDSVDFVVTTLHWGDEFMEYPARYQVELARKLVDGGVDAVIGHHTHMVQGVESYNGGVIAYSLGNFVYDQWQRRLRRSMILDLKLSKGARPEFEIVPVMINRRHQPEIVDGPPGTALRNELEALTAKIGTVEPEAYDAELQRNYKRFRREVYAHYLTHAFKYAPRDLLSNLAGAIRRRV